MLIFQWKQFLTVFCIDLYRLLHSSSTQWSLFWHEWDCETVAGSSIFMHSTHYWSKICNTFIWKTNKIGMNFRKQLHIKNIMAPIQWESWNMKTANKGTTMTVAYVYVWWTVVFDIRKQHLNNGTIGRCFAIKIDNFRSFFSLLLFHIENCKSNSLEADITIDFGFKWFGDHFM